MDRHNEWRKRQIALEPALVRDLHQWHGGQGSHLYALASTGQHDLVSLSMIDAALRELETAHKAARGARNRAAARRVLGELGAVRIFWRESSARELGISPSGYDRRDYGTSEAEERAIETRSG